MRATKTCQTGTKQELISTQNPNAITTGIHRNGMTTPKHEVQTEPQITKLHTSNGNSIKITRGATKNAKNQTATASKRHKPTPKNLKQLESGTTMHE